MRRVSASDERASSQVEQRHSRVNRTRFELIVLVGFAAVLSIDGEGQNAFVHVKENSYNSLSLEGPAIGFSSSIGMVSELSHSEKCPAKFLITKSRTRIAFRRLRYTYLEFMLSARISNYLPVVDTCLQRLVTVERPEEVVILIQKDPSLVCCHCYYSTRVLIGQ